MEFNLVIESSLALCAPSILVLMQNITSLETSLNNKQCPSMNLAKKHTHDVVGVGNVNLQFPNGEKHPIGSLIYSFSIKKNILFVRNIVNWNHNFKLFSKGCFIINYS